MRRGLSAAQVDWLQVGLMLVSAAAAFAWPFHVFLFAYAVFGPLHYLTEISWLHDRSYFTKRRRDVWLLVGIGVLIAAEQFGLLPGLSRPTIAVLIFVAFAAALAFATTTSFLARLAAIGGAFVLGRLLAGGSQFESIVGMFLPTLVHVSLFTACFLLVGALRGRRISGLVAVGTFVALSIALFVVRRGTPGPGVSQYVRDSYGAMNDRGGIPGLAPLQFHALGALGIYDFGAPRPPLADFARGVNDYLFTNPAALAVASFIAFSYCYHYLNWFSKTSVIRWHEVPRRRLVGVAVGWTASLALYAYDYALGLKWLFFLSLSHVLLEFPLNHATIVNIGRELRAVAGRGPSLAPTSVPE